MSESEVDKLRRLVLEKQCADVGRQIEKLLPAGTGFVFVAYDFGEKGNMAFISSGQRAGTILMLEELVGRLKGAMS